MDNELFPEDSGATYGDILPLKRQADGSLALAWPGFVHGMVNSAYNAITAPGETLTGKTPTGIQLSAVPDPLRAAGDITGTMLGLGIGAPVPAGASRVFGGLAAKTADLDAFNTAAAMKQTGHSATDIWNSTGWFQDVDGHWKFEIPDKKAFLKGSGLTEIPFASGVEYAPAPGGKLSDVLHHPDLFAAYPDMANIPVNTTFDEGVRGGYNQYTNTMKLAPGSDARAMTSTILHETQHGIQGREGFATGGSPEEFLPLGAERWNREYDNTVASLKDVRNLATSAGFAPAKMEQTIGKFIMGRDLGEKEEAELAAMATSHPELATKWVDTLSDLSILHSQHKAALNAYSNLAGEVEARNVQERWENKLGNETPPWMTQGYPQGKQNVRFNEPIPVEHNPFTHSLEPIDHNPFLSLVPVDINPFEEK